MSQEINSIIEKRAAKRELLHNLSLLIARIGIASLMLVHGFPKMIQLLSGDPVAFPAVMGMNAQTSLTLAVLAEVLCSVLILVGLKTRISTIPLIITMLVAVFSIHSDGPFAKQELGLLYLLVYLALLLAGGGKYSTDYFLHKRSVHPITA